MVFDSSPSDKSCSGDVVRWLYQVPSTILLALTYSAADHSALAGGLCFQSKVCSIVLEPDGQIVHTMDLCNLIQFLSVASAASMVRQICA